MSEMAFQPEKSVSRTLTLLLHSIPSMEVTESGIERMNMTESVKD